MDERSAILRTPCQEAGQYVRRGPTPAETPPALAPTRADRASTASNLRCSTTPPRWWATPSWRTLHVCQQQPARLPGPQRPDVDVGQPDAAPGADPGEHPEARRWRRAVPQRPGTAHRVLRPAHRPAREDRVQGVESFDKAQQRQKVANRLDTQPLVQLTFGAGAGSKGLQHVKLGLGVGKRVKIDVASKAATGPPPNTGAAAPAPPPPPPPGWKPTRQPGSLAQAKTSSTTKTPSSTG